MRIEYGLRNPWEKLRYEKITLLERELPDFNRDIH